tara:strand:+ start:119 stop:283 length:165 start_codon:yes stop_codon:yes gene_type:complete
MLSLLFFYFALGFSFSFAGLPMQLRLINDFGATPAELTTLWGFVSVPWYVDDAP